MTLQNQVSSSGVSGAPPSSAAADNNPVRVMVVDDSAVIRGLITRIVEADPNLNVVASVSDGQRAVDRLAKSEIDVIILDIEMPVMDGLTALPELLKTDPDIKVIMASTLTLRNADISMKAMQLGAADYIPKPTASGEINGRDEFGRVLIEKVRSLGQARRRRRRPIAAKAAAAKPTSAGWSRPGQEIALRPVSKVKPRVLAIGSSTGGPQALFKLLGDLAGRISLPVLVTQHMPATFTTILAQHIAQNTSWSSAEATDGQTIEPGCVHVAPGDFHMIAEMRGDKPSLRLSTDAPENFCRPAVDPMLRSLSDIYGSAMLTVILTGMGSDGLKGSQYVVEKGGTIVAQDEATSVVWGMPGAVASNGVCSAVLPLDDLANCVVSLVERGAL